MYSRLVRLTLLLLVTFLLSSCGRGGYLFISDRDFAVLEGEALTETLGGTVVIESFTSPPEAGQVRELADEMRPAGLFFSPLYHGLASSVARLAPGVPVYAVLPPGSKPPADFHGAVFDLAGAGRLILKASAEAFPADGPDSILLLYAAAETGLGWSFIEKELNARFPSGTVESYSLPLQPDSGAQSFSFLQRNTYDLLLILASRLTPGLTEALAAEFPEAFFICDHPPEHDFGIEGGYLVYRWARLYSSLLEGEKEADTWLIRPFTALSAP
jgi:hypothetical protein